MSDQPAPTASPAPCAPSAPYRVLARKYRPTRFADLIGQEALVRTLTNAMRSGRLAHAYILTGVRGVGKTTTARIIARALNCTGPDGAGGPTPEPCGQCPNCVAIAEDRHVDVMEMDAASRTGIDDIRELIEGVRYRPVQARKKVYIIDEVHMLSRQAFNGLLKTLEEPPEHVVFIFATTEIRKVPVTVLSRCQRFDLRRVDQDVLTAHFARIAAAEAVRVSDAALALIARAADGSVRDGLSLLDQAIALGGDDVSEDQVRGMLGLVDRTRVFDLFEALMAGQPADALAILSDLHAGGADPAVVVQDLLELTHFVTRAKLVPETLSARDVPEAERERGRGFAERLGLAVLARAWQILLKGLGEVQSAPAPLRAAEMVLIRLAYASELPTPAEALARLEGAPPAPRPSDGDGGSAGRPMAQAAPASGGTGATARAVAAPELASDTAQAADPAPTLRTLEDVVALLRARRETILANHLENDVHLVRFEPGRIELRPLSAAPRNLAGRVAGLLQEATGARWVVTLSQEEGDPTLRARQREAQAREEAEILGHPLVKAAMETFPGARLVEARAVPRPADATGSQDEGEQDR